jgi:transposase
MENTTGEKQMPKEIDAGLIFKLILNFLQLLMPQTLAKRITSMSLIAAGIPNERVSELTGLCDRSVRSLRKALERGETENIFHVGGGGGQSKLAGLESAIIEEIESGSYSNRQQIADMIQEKYGIKVTLNTISNFLKKTASSG